MQPAAYAVAQLCKAGRGPVALQDNRPATAGRQQVRQAMHESPHVHQLKQRAQLLTTASMPVQRKANTTGLPDQLKSGIEHLSGYSMDDVKVHYNSSQPAQLQAHAYAQGTDIHVAPGQEKHLPHEAWHVVQQKQGRVKPTMQLKSKVNVNDDAGLEKEADVMGAKSLATAQRKASGGLVEKRIAGHAQPLQAVLNVAAFNATAGGAWGTTNKTLRKNTIIDAANNYNRLLNGNTQSQGDLNGLMEALDILEHKIYRWFDATKGNPMNGNHTAMFNLMDEVQAEHKQVVGMVVGNNRNLWVKDRGGNSQRDIQALWTEITSGNGHFNVVNTVADQMGLPQNIPPQFLQQMRIELFASFARLMSRPQGIKLLMLFKNGQARDKDLSFVLEPLYNLVLGGAMGPNRAIATDDTNAKMTLHNNGGIGKGNGSDAGIRFVPGMRDSSVMDRDVNNNPILSPTFVGFGHEITHSAHYQNGSYASGLNMAGLPGAYHNDLEEFMTITPSDEQATYNSNAVTGSFIDPSTKNQVNGNTTFSRIRAKNKGIPTEGDIRREHGLSIRHGHTGTIANPQLHPGGLQTIPDTANWAAPLHQALAPPPVHNAPPQQQQGGGCFLTTACTQARGLPDDCEELTVLRHFRDTYLLHKPDGKALVRLYYNVAPGIVSGIQSQPDAQRILDDIYKVIRKCVKLIGRDKLEETYLLYMRMVKKLQAQYGQA